MAAPPTVTIAGTNAPVINKPTNQGGTIIALTQFADALITPPGESLNPAITGASPTPAVGQQLQPLSASTGTMPYQTLNQFIGAFAAAYGIGPNVAVQWVINTLQGWRENYYN